MIAASKLQQLERTTKLACPPPTKQPVKLARFTIRSGTTVDICSLESTDADPMRVHNWQPHRTKVDLAFEKYERYDARYKSYEFRHGAWLIYVHRSKVQHREDSY